jgi:acyl transferase domain-containing protein/thioesterase domain-containing protein/acyl carrier protein
MKPSTIAIVGMAGRFPGARNLREFWQNLHDGVESIRSLTDGELLAAGADAEELRQADYVKRASILDDVPLFDAAFFGLSPRDAAIMDPQHRHFLECAWEALEDAGHPPHGFSGSIGVFAGSGMNSYLIHNLLANRRLTESAGLFQLKQTGNDKDVLATRVSYQLDLRGPSINVQTACSTSLVAVHLACQSLLNYECDMALAGGVTIEIPHGRGYTYREGEILSRDGHCRSFDAASTGTVFGSGAGIVVLRRLEDAIADRDNLRAVILGSAINNDGARKVGYLAPSVEGQAEVVAEALEFAGVNADDISYVETHGTGTIVGDPIEVKALTQAFRKSTARKDYCAIGSLKTNVGHLDAAAGVAGLIKTVLALEHTQLPASLHFSNPNPHIDFQSSPFFVNSKLSDWSPGSTPRRAGVTSLGIGGTNAHVILEEAPPQVVSQDTKPYLLLTISAKTENAVERACENVIAHLDAHPDLRLADAAFTSQLGRRAFPHRRAIVIANTRDSIASVAKGERGQFVSGVAEKSAPQIVLMFSGQGAQYVNMGRELYAHEPVFRDSLDRCAESLLQPLGMDLRDALYPPAAEEDSAREKLNQTWLTQPALFAIEYSLARWWMSLGIEPTAMVGHSIGEYVAACLAGVFSLEDGLAIAAFRGRLMNDLPTGAMLAVSLPDSALRLSGNLSLAAVNNPGQSVVSGPASEIDALEKDLAAQSIACRRLITSHAFHSAMMDPILGDFEKRLRGITYHPPSIRYLSNVTGTWIKTEEAADPAYWSRHLRHTVRFSDCLTELFRNQNQILIEAGPGNTLTSLARQQGGAAVKAFQSLPHPREATGALRFALQTLGQLWAHGANVDFVKLHSPASVRRVPLPTYPFEHRSFWIEPDKAQAIAAPLAAGAPTELESNNILLYRRAWKSVPLTRGSFSEGGCWVIFNDALGLGNQIGASLLKAGQHAILVEAGTSYKHSDENRFTVRPGMRADFDALIGDIRNSGFTPSKILHLWSVMAEGVSNSLREIEDRCFLSILFLTQALTDQDITDLDIAVVSNHLQQVGEELVRNPARAVLLGPGRVIPKELPGVTCRCIDVDFVSEGAGEHGAAIVDEMCSSRDNSTVALRHGERFVEVLEPLTLAEAPQNARLERGGVYLVTGGLGGIGLVVAEQLAREFKACLVLVTRSALPPEAQWEASLTDASLSEAEKGKIRKLVEIRSIAGGLLVAQGDVTDLGQMRDVVAMATKQFGKIDGVFHAAGILDDGPLMLKSARSAARVLDPKVRGTLVLEAALGNVPLRCFVLFSSISSILPPPGQVDYAAANAFLDAFALSRKGPVTVVNWGAWQGVGMAARSGSPHPLLRERLLDTPQAIAYESRLSQHEWVLAEHKLKAGDALKALLPGTGYMEMASAAFPHGMRQGALEFHNVFFLVPLMLESDENREVRVQLKREQESDSLQGSFRFSVFSRAGDWVEHCTGIIAPCLSRLTAQIDRAAISARCRKREIVFDEQHRTRQEQQLIFGPRWRSLRRLLLGNGEALAELELDAKLIGDVSAFRMHPALLDLATGASLYLTAGYDASADLFLPISYKKMTVYHSLPPKLFSHIRLRPGESRRSEVVTFDITLFDEQGQVLVEIDGFAMRRIVDSAKVSQENVSVRDARRSGSEQPIEIAGHTKISPHEGARILTRILMVRTPTAVVAVPQAIEDFAAHGANPSPTKIVAAEASSPPDNKDVAETLASWWQELLGVEQVGLDDDFFALGGHSLVGVRLFAKIKKAYKVDLQLAILFEASTVRRLADVIRKERQPVTVEPKAWPHLIPIQPKGSRIPIFCVHAIGGDVVFYEPLSKALGADQPFYAFRSPHLTGEGFREKSIEEMASIYIKELRAFYPQGPYLLGGASFGGIAAFEMAQQLCKQGAEPTLLFLFDTSAPGSIQRVESKEKIRAFRQRLRDQGVPYLLRKVALKFEHWGQSLIKRAKSAACFCYRVGGRDLPIGLRYFQVEKAHWIALTRYKIQKYPGKIDLLRAVDRGYSGMELLGTREEPDLGWGNLAGGGLEVHDVSGEHGNVLREPQVRTVAEALKTILPRLGTKAPSQQPVA